MPRLVYKKALNDPFGGQSRLKLDPSGKRHRSAGRVTSPKIIYARRKARMVGEGYRQMTFGQAVRVRQRDRKRSRKLSEALSKNRAGAVGSSARPPRRKFSVKKAGLVVGGAALAAGGYAIYRRRRSSRKGKK